MSHDAWVAWGGKVSTQGRTDHQNISSAYHPVYSCENTGWHADEMCMTSMPPDNVAYDGGMVRGSYLRT